MAWMSGCRAWVLDSEESQSEQVLRSDEDRAVLRAECPGVGLPLVCKLGFSSSARLSGQSRPQASVA